MSGLTIIDPGLATSLQDTGRTGHLRYGVPVCGALDADSMRIANAIVGNEDNAPVLEVRFLGPSFKVSVERIRVAFSGALLNIRVERNGEEVLFDADRSFVLLKDDKVTTGPLRGSSTACMAVEGGFAVEPVLGSAATDIKSGISGFGSSRFEAGTVLPLQIETVEVRPDMALPVSIELQSNEPILVMMGPQDDYFTEATLDIFLNTEWKVSQQADRMGMRLDGPDLEHSKGHDIASDGIANGAIQVPGSRQPIVLLADRQTSGGYPKIATVISAELPRMGRMAPGTTIRFQSVEAAEAVELAREHERQMQNLLRTIAPYHPPGEIDLAALASGNIISAPVGLE
ncbi:MAG: biotin-dependent carboxyltransferase family protein [Rhizobiaceae bacterium]